MSLETVTADSAVLSGTVGDQLTTIAQIEERAEFNPDLPYLVVTHEAPDTDAIASLWFVDEFLAKRNASVRFVRSGERLPIHEGIGHNVIHVDTGFGRFDQHGKSMQRGSSFLLLVEHFGYAEDPGMKPLIELTRATDNVEKVDACSVHNVFKMLRGTVKGEDGQPDWDAIIHYAFVSLRCLYSFHTTRAESVERFREVGKVETLPSGITFANIACEPRLREAAYAEGAEVVLWFSHQGRKGYYVGIQVKNGCQVKLGKVGAALRMAEAKERKTHISRVDTIRLGNLKGHPTWFVHQSNKLILAGSTTHPLSEEEFTKLSKGKIERLVKEILSEK